MANLAPETAARLRQLLRRHPNPDASQLHLINLEVVKEYLGPLWELRHARLKETILAMIERHLSREDVAAAAGDASFLIVFADLVGEGARAVCTRIVADLEHFFLGSDDLGRVSVKMVTASLAGIVAQQPLSDRARFDALLEEAQRWHVGKPNHRQEEDDPASFNQKGRDAPPAPHDAALGDELRLSPDWEKQVPHIKQSVFARVWDISRRAIHTFRCVPLKEGNGAEGRNGEFFDARRDRWSVQHRLLLDAIGALRTMDELGQSCFMVASLDVGLLIHLRRLPALACALRQAGKVAHRRLFVELIDDPGDLSWLRVRRAADSIRPFVRGVLVRTGLDPAAVRRVEGTMPFAIGAWLGGTQGDKAEGLEEALGEWATAVQRLGHTAYLFGIPRTSLLLAAMHADVRFVTLHRVEWLAAPHPPRRFALDELHAAAAKLSP